MKIIHVKFDKQDYSDGIVKYSTFNEFIVGNIYENGVCMSIDKISDGEGITHRVSFIRDGKQSESFIGLVHYYHCE